MYTSSVAGVPLRRKYIYTADEFSDLEPQSVGFLIDRLIPKEGIVLFHGKYGSYKTALTLNIAKAVAGGTPIWGIPAAPAKVLYVEGDTPIHGILPRSKTLGIRGLPLHIASIYPGMDVINYKRDPLARDKWEELHASHLQEHYGLIVLDSLRSLHSMDETRGETAREVYRALAMLFPECCLIVIHHDRKTKDDPKANQFKSQEQIEVEHESFMGSQRWIDMATTSIKVAKHGRTGIVMTQTKSQVGDTHPQIYVPRPEDGVTMNGEATINDQTISTFVGSIDPARMARIKLSDLDEILANRFGVSVRFANTKRVEWEEEHGEIQCARPFRRRK